MTIKEAREYYGIKEGETVYAKGINYLISVNVSRRNVWSLSSSDREKITKDIEALQALLQIAK